MPSLNIFNVYRQLRKLITPDYGVYMSNLFHCTKFRVKERVQI